MQTNPTPLFTNNERGIYIPVMAIIVGAILFLILSLGVDSGINMTTRVKAQRFLEIICEPQSLPITRAATIDTIDRLNTALASGAFDFLLKHATIEEFRIIFPTPPSDGSLRQDDYRGQDEPIFGSPEPTADPLAHIDKNCSSKVERCLVGGQVFEDSVFQDYPRNFWNINHNGYIPEEDPRNNDSFGDVFACDMTIKPKALFKNSESIKLKVVYEKYQKGAIYPDDGVALPAPPATARNQFGGGLIIGVATQMTTRLSTPFLFDSNHDRFNPNPALRAMDSFSLGRPEDVVMNLLGSHRFLDVSDGPYPRSERMLACMNPAILMRNAFLTTLVGFAARDGLRDRTEIVHINPIHLNNPNPDPEVYRELNPPTILWQGWNDIAGSAAAGNIPYVHYRKANGTYLKPEAEGSPMDRILAGQLRDCFHMFEGDAAGGIDRYTDYQLNNSGFEPEALTNVSMAETLTSYNPGGSPSRWDSEPLTPHFSAEQLVSVLGSTQSCPHGSIGDPGDWPAEYHDVFDVYSEGSLIESKTYGEHINCNKPAIVEDSSQVPEDLRGDIEGFLAYLINQYPAPGSNPNSPTWLSGFGAHRFPGRTQAGLSVRDTVFSQGATAVLVTHKRITPNDVLRIQTMMARVDPRIAVHVVYIPTNRFDASEAVIQRYQEAFDTPGGDVYTYTGVGDVKKNQLLVLLSTICPNGNECASPSSAWPPWFSTFWNTQLKTDEIGVPDTARRFYNNVIKGTRVKL